MLLFHTENLPHYGLERIFELAKEAGFKGIELSINTCFDTQTPDYIRKLEKRYKIKVKAFSIAEGTEESLFRAFQVTVREFPKSHMILVPPRSFGGKYKKWMEEIVPRLAKKYNLVACRRNAQSQNVVGIIPSRQKMSLSSLKESGDVCLDVSSMAASNQEIMRTIPYFGKQLKHIYLSNYYKEQPYALPDRGILPLENFLTKLKSVKYKGHITLRVAPDQINEGDDEKVLEGMKQALKFYKTYFEDAK